MCRQRAVISCLLDRFILNNYYARINSTIVIESSFKCFKMSVGIKEILCLYRPFLTPLLIFDTKKSKASFIFSAIN